MLRTGISDTADDLIDWLIDRLAGADVYMLGKIEEYLVSSTYNTPDVANNSIVEWFHSSLLGLWVVLFLTSIIVAGISMIVRRDISEPGSDLARALLVNILGSGAGSAIIVIVGKVADSFTAWIISANALDVKQLATNIKNLDDGLGTVESFILLILVVALCFGAFIILFSLVTRPALLILLAGILPLATAATNLGWGRNWMEKTISWVASFVVFKPAVAAIIIMGGLLGASAQLDDFAETAMDEICTPGTQAWNNAITIIRGEKATSGSGNSVTWKEQKYADYIPPEDETRSKCESSQSDLIDDRTRELAGDGFSAVFMGMVVLGMAGLSLPALIKFITPAVAASGSQGGAGMSRIAATSATGAASLGGAVVGFGLAQIGARVKNAKDGASGAAGAASGAASVPAAGTGGTRSGASGADGADGASGGGAERGGGRHAMPPAPAPAGQPTGAGDGDAGGDEPPPATSTPRGRRVQPVGAGSTRADGTNVSDSH